MGLSPAFSAPEGSTAGADSPDLSAEEWLNTPAARQAKSIAGWPDCTPEEFIKSLILVLDVLDEGSKALDAELAKRGMSYGDWLKIVTDARAENGSGQNGTPAQRYGIRRLHLGGFTHEQVAGMLNIPVTDVDEYIHNQRMLEAGSEIVRLHHDGLSPQQISKQLDVARGDVYKVLSDINQKPHRAQRRLTNVQKIRIVDLYNNGCSYAEIKAELGLDKSQVTNTLRLAAKKGRVPEYGKRLER